MADLQWPASLPQAPLLSSYAVKADSGIIRTPMESGLARQRKRFSTPTSRVTVAWKMTGQQCAFFKSWLVHKAANGGAWFDLSLRLDDGPKTVEARFTQDASYKLMAGRAAGAELWLVSSEIEIKDIPPYSSDLIDLMTSGIVEDVLATAGALTPPYLSPAIERWDLRFGL